MTSWSRGETKLGPVARLEAAAHQKKNKADMEPACSVAKKTATDPSKSTNSAHRASLSGVHLVESGFCLKDKKINDTKPPGIMAEVTHPSGVVVEVVGIEKGDRGRSCGEHDVCGEVVERRPRLHAFG